MPAYQYKAKNSHGENVSGVVHASHREAAIKDVMGLNLVPIEVFALSDVEKESPNRERQDKQKRISLKDKVWFTRQLSDLIDASLPLAHALKVIEKQVSFKSPLHMLILSIRQKVENGASFSQALDKHPKSFNSFYVNMVKTGEMGAKLPLVLNRLAGYLEKENESIRKIRMGMAYPLLILGVGLLTSFVLLTWIVPRLAVMFEDLNQELPLATRLLIRASDFFASYWFYILCVFVLLGYVIKLYFRSYSGRSWLHRVQLGMPIGGPFMKKIILGRFTRTLGALIETGVDISTALNAARTTVTNSVMRRDIDKLTLDVRNGDSLKKALNQSDHFPFDFVSVVAIGEETGRLAPGLHKIATTYERESDDLLKMLISLLGPVMLIFIVMFVGFIIISLLLPILQMNLII